MNSILGGNPLIQTLITASKMKNPEQILGQVAMSNPQINQILKDYQSSGKTSKEFFEERATAMGVDPNEIVSMLK